MNKPKILYLIDFLLLITLIANILSITVQPLKSYKVHEFTGYLFLGLTAAHLLQHYKWIIKTTRNFFK